MKRKIVFSLFFLLFAMRIAFADPIEERRPVWQDDYGRLNGWYIKDLMIEKNFGSKGERMAEEYIAGVINAITTLNPRFWNATYPNKGVEDVTAAVKKFYTVNPLSRRRAVVDVILSGCKSAVMEEPQDVAVIKTGKF